MLHPLTFHFNCYTFLFVDGIFDSFSNLFGHVHSSPLLFFGVFFVFLNISNIHCILCLLILMSEVFMGMVRLMLFLLSFTYGAMFPCVLCFFEYVIHFLELYQ